MEFKKGDRVRCKPGYNNIMTRGIAAVLDMSYGGFGYEEGRVFIIESFVDDRTRMPVFGTWSNGESMGGGVFIDAIEHCTSLQDFSLRKHYFAN